MGYYEARNGTTSFKPDNTDTELWLPYSASMSDIVAEIEDQWPGAKAEDIAITPAHIHTYCIGYDRYDPNDYTNYLHIQYTKQ